MNGRGWLAAAAVLAAPAQAQVANNELRVHYINVGQANAALLEFSCGVVMIDAGAERDSDTARLIAYVRSLFQRRPELNNTIATLFITHNHVDHTSALDEVLSAFTVTNLVENGVRGSARDPGDASLRWLAGELAARRQAVAVTNLDDADVASTGYGLSTPEIDPLSCTGTDPAITVLSADLAANPGWTAAEFKNKNNGSLVIRVDFGQASFLFTGDLEEPAIETMVAYYAGSPALDVDVWLVGHHGSANGTTWSLLQALNDLRIAVVSMGACAESRALWTAYRYGHPRAGVVDMLRSAIDRRRSSAKNVLVAEGVGDFHRSMMRDAVYGTGWDGTVTVLATASGAYTVNVERPSDPAAC